MPGSGRTKTVSASGWESIKGYGLAVLTVGAALASRLAFDTSWGNERPYFTFYLAAIITMSLAGGGPGLLSILSGLLLGTWFFVAPRHSLVNALADGWVNAVTYLVSSVVVLGFVVRAKRALAREQANTKELRRHADALQASEQRFQTLAEAAFEGVLLSQNGVIKDCNDQVATIVGYTRDELLGKPMTDFVLPDQRNLVLRNVREQKEAAYDIVLICKDGSKRIVEAHGRPLRGSDGAPLRVSVIRDISQQKEREEALRRQAALIDLSPDGIFVKNINGTISFWSRGAEALYGWSAGEAVGANSEELLRTEYPIPYDKLLEELRHKGKWSGELKHRTKAGQILHIESRWLALRAENEEEILESNTDITERKRGEEALKSAKEALLQANFSLEQRVLERTRSLEETTEELNAFCYTIAHDLRSRLRTQLGFAKMLVDDYGDRLGEDGVRMAERISQAAERQSMLIQDLLAHARVSQESMPRTKVNLQQVVHRALDDTAMEIKEKGGAVDQSGLGNAWVLANPTSLHLVMVNLLSNALKFIKPGTHPSVRLRTEAHDGFVRLWVEDNGIGIGLEERDKLFGMFHRLHSAKSYPGTGMGLAIVKKAMRRMGGNVGVESQVGKGSRFWVELPVA